MDTHAKRRNLHIPQRLGDQVADWTTAFVGSWIFLFLHVGWFSLWIVLRVEPFPYGLLTMAVSLEAIFLSTLVMMSQNRQAEKDQRRDNLEATEIQSLYDGHALLLQINQQQVEILDQQTEMLERHREMLTLLREGIPPPSPSQRRKKGES